jgi:lipoic acid synthetase
MKPAWLNKKIDLRACSELKQSLRGLGVDTVCEQAMCPNIGECFSNNQATFLILGSRCTRKCSFCNIKKGEPVAPDLDEPGRVAAAVEKLGLRHVVVTSVTRDDLVDGGAKAFADTVGRIRCANPQTKIELLIPDFKLSMEAIKTVVESGPDIIAHNVETVPALYSLVRQGADYRRSLEVLRMAGEIASGIKTKSGFMLGLGEKPDEIIGVMKDLRSVNCDYLSIGQYLAPSLEHYPVKEHIRPQQFDYYRNEALRLGFSYVASGPYVRSSYLAEDYLNTPGLKG